MVIGSALHAGQVTPRHNNFLQTQNATTSDTLQAVLEGVLLRAGQWQHNAILHPLQEGNHSYGIKVFHDEPEEHETKFFEEEDIDSWVIFTLVFLLLIIFDTFVLHRKAEKLNLLQAFLYTTFWVSCAGAFAVYVYHSRGLDDSFTWVTGYILEWMLSIDNLFVFQKIFEAFHTPDEQKHKPLFYGIMGAIVFRMLFFLAGEWAMHHFWWVHIIFGLFLVYTGVKIVWMGEEDDDDNPEEGWLFQQLVKYINYVDKYDDDGNFFMPVYIDKASKKVVDKPLADNADVEVEYRATKLVIVVICLEATDLLFAVDSVSAIIAQIPDLFLAYTACVFAMLGLRALFFAIDELVKMFTLLNYGVSFILVFLGFKLIFKSWIHINPVIVCVILLGTIAISILASVVKDRMSREQDGPPEDARSPAAR